MRIRPAGRDKRVLPKTPDAEPDLRRAIDTIPQLVWSAFPDGSVEFCNRGWLEYTGLTAEQAQGWGWRAAIHPEDLDELVATWRRVLIEGIPGQAEARMRKADGSFRWFLIQAKPLRDDQGRIVRWYGTNTNIDERKRAEERLSLANDRLRLAMEASASVGWDSEVKSGQDIWFGDLRTIFGIPSATYAASVEEFLRYVHPDDRPQVSEALADARQNRKLYAAEFRIVRPDGTIRWLVARGKFYYATNGDPERMLGVSLDITDRKQAEDAVRETEKRYRRIVETTNEGVWLLDSKLHTTYVNRQMAEMLGYEPGEMIGRSVFDSYFPEDVERKKQVLKRRQQGVREQFEERLRRRDGSELWVRMAAIPVFNENGEFDGALAMVSDITERKRTEEALRESEARLRLAAQAGRMYAYEWDVATDKVVRSEECVNVLGFNDSAKQLSRQQLLASVHADDRALFVGSVDQATPENPTTQISYRMLRPDGSVVWLEKNARAFFDEQGKMLRVIGMVADITGRKRTEEALSESKERFRLFINHSPAVAWMKDEQGHYIYVNETYQKQLGVRLEDRLGKTDFEVYPRSIAEQFRNNDQAALAMGHSIEVTEESIDPEGAPCTWLAYKFPFQDASGQIFVGGIAVNITERKTLEESLHALTGRLIHAQEEERARISRELHDDFSQRLAILSIGLEELWKTLPEVDVENRARVQEMLKAAGELSFDLHSLSHELHSRRLDLVGLVSALDGLCKEISEKYKIEVHFTKCDVRLKIPKDVALCLFRVAQEALGNIVKHSQAKNAHVEFGANASGVSIRIRDDGRGFNPDRINAGPGIGLIGMHERIRLVGGRLFVTSELGRGTEILVEVPLYASTNEAEARVQSAGK